MRLWAQVKPSLLHLQLPQGCHTGQAQLATVQQVQILKSEVGIVRASVARESKDQTTKTPVSSVKRTMYSYHQSPVASVHLALETIQKPSVATWGGPSAMPVASWRGPSATPPGTQGIRFAKLHSGRLGWLRSPTAASHCGAWQKAVHVVGGGL